MPQLYLYSSPDKSLKVFNTKQIHDLVQEGDLAGDSYVYHFDKSQWIQVQDIGLLKTLEIPLPHFEQTGQRPDFTPPPIELTPYIEQAKNDECDLLLLYYKKLQYKYLTLTEQLGQEKTEDHESQNDAQFDNSKIVELEEENKRLREEMQGLNDKFTKIKSFAECKDKHINEQDDEILRLEQEVAKLKAHLKISPSLSPDELRKKDSHYQDLSKKLKVYEEELKKNKDFIERIQQSQQQKTDEEIQRLTGDSFEIANHQVWYYKQAGKENGPYTFECMLGLQKNETIAENTLVKNCETNTTWKALKEHFEFGAPFEVVESQEDGKTIKRYFMKRNNIRVPIHEIMRLEIGEEEFKGYCTSLSLGGCFLELTRLKEEDFEKGQTGTFYLNDEILGGPISGQVTVMNICLTRPKGVGLMFNNLDEESTSLIKSYISEILDKMGHNTELD